MGLCRWAPDGGSVVFTASLAGEGRVDPVIRNESLWSVPVAGGPARQLLDPEAYTLASPGGDIAVTGRGVLFSNEHRGAVQLLRVPFDGGTPEVLLDGQRQVAGFASPAGGTLVATIAGPADWGEVYAGDVKLTGFSAGESRPSTRSRCSATAPDGYPVHGWVAAPPGAGPHPVLLIDPRRPVRAVRLALFDEAQVYAGGRVRGRARQPARLVRLRRGARPGDPAAARQRRRRRRAGAARRRAAPTRSSTPTGSASWAARTAAS